VAGSTLQIVDVHGAVMATAGGIDAAQVDGHLWWSPGGTRLAVGLTVTDHGVLREEVRLLRWDGRALTVDRSVAPVRAGAIRWDGERPVALPATIAGSHPTADGTWTVAVSTDGTLHLFGPDGRGTVLFAGTKFVDADALQDGGH